MRVSFNLALHLAIASGLAPSRLAPMRTRSVLSMSEVPKFEGATSRRQALLTGAGLSLASAVAPPAFAAESGGYQGVYSDPKHPKGYRVLRAVNAGSTAIELQDEPNADIFSVAGTSTFDKAKGETTIKIGMRGRSRDIDIRARSAR